MASSASSNSGYQSAPVILPIGAGLLTGIVGIWMPVISQLAGFDGVNVLANPIWGLAYNAMSGIINVLLGSAPGSLGGILELCVGGLVYPMLVCGAVFCAMIKYQNWKNNVFKVIVGITFCLTLLTDMPVDWFASNGPTCGFFLYPAMIY